MGNFIFLIIILIYDRMQSKGDKCPPFYFCRRNKIGATKKTNNKGHPYGPIRPT